MHGLDQLARFPEPAKQAALADVLLLTKNDVAGAIVSAQLKVRLARLNPAASMLEVHNGQLSPDALFAKATPDPRANDGELASWLAADAYHDDSHDHGHHHHDRSRHGDKIRAFCMTHDEPISLADLKTWLQSISSLRGRDLLRIKGVVNVAGQPGPVIVQGVQHLLHPLVPLPRWPIERGGTDTRTRIVFITHDIPQAAIEASFAILTA